MDAAIVINSENEIPQFIISLEEVDMGLLPLHNYKRWQKMKTKAVWDILDSRCGPEYYEFELHTKDTSEDECLEVQRCHICDVEVPVAFQEDHSRSPRHRAFSTIAEIALEKTRRQISMVSSVAASPGNWHYCLSCSCAVSLSNIQGHENSEEHKIALKFEKLINALALIYEDKSNVTRLYDEIKNDISELSITKDKEGIIETTSLETLKVSYDSEININDGISNKTDTTKIMKDNINVDNKTDAVTALDLEVYISDINQNSTHTVKCIDNAVLVTTMSGAVIKIHFDNFHGFFESGNKTMCKLCREVVVDKNRHCLEAPHKEKLKKTIINKHGIRQLDSIWNHCVLCNEIVENSEAHVLCSDDHNKFLQNAVLIDEKPAVEPTKSTSADTQANNLHPPNNDHKYNSWLANKETVLHHHFKNTHVKNVKICTICDFSIVGNAQIINQHIASDSHIKEHTQLLQNNYLKKVNNATYYCTPCSFYVSNLKDLVHINSLTHEKNMREVKEKAERERAENERAKKEKAEKERAAKLAAAATASNTDGVRNGYCYICNVKVTDNHNNIKTHINGLNHRDNKKIIEGIPVINGFCKICKVKVPDNQTNITQHINGQLHREAIFFRKFSSILQKM